MAKPQEDPLMGSVDEILETVTADGPADSDQMKAFFRLFQNRARWPADGFVLGEPVSVKGLGLSQGHGGAAAARRLTGGTAINERVGVAAR